MSENFGNWQSQIYFRGYAGEVPELPVDLLALEAAAEAVLEPGPFGYVAGGASSEDTMRANRDAFARWRIVPRMLRDVDERRTAVTVCGTDLHSPLLTAPIGVQTIVHPDGELAVARACAETGVGMVLSTASSYTLEEVAAEAGDAPRWFQLYWPRDDDLAVSFVHRAEEAGFTAIVVTLDTLIIGWRPRDLQTAYLPFLHGVGVANWFQDPHFRSQLAKPPEEDQPMAVLQFGAVFSDPSSTWERLEKLRAATTLPIILKGIQHPDDARHAVEAGADGIVVSNHGGRQVDGAIASLDALPGVVDEVGGEIDVLFDSGIRTGSDGVKALALGAQAVLLGRPWVWGLALGGQAGVAEVLRNWLADFDLAMALSGVADVGDLDRSLLVEA
ncbi:MAG: lactate 2-monooxygenase [Nitriliruptorales bacterium]|nr:lactate 2-monooxygenase [Nitriliruptorales bacterium]